MAWEGDRRDESSRPGSIAVAAITVGGVRLALQIQAQLPGSICYVPRRHAFALVMGARPFDRLKDLVPEIWTRHRAMVFVMATGIVVRLIAPLVHQKMQDPAVVVVDEKGHFVISLLSGHWGGANALAESVARITGGLPVVTTASDVCRRPAIDLLARKAGLVIENPEALPRIARAVLEDEPLWLFDPARRLGLSQADLPQVRFWGESHPAWEPRRAPATAEAGGAAGEGPSGAAELIGVWVSEKASHPEGLWLRLRPRNLVVGVGCNRGTSAEEILEAVRRVLDDVGLAPPSIRNFASVDLKAEEGGLLEAARRLDRPLEFFSPKDLRGVAVPHPSRRVAEHIGVPSVCEAAAILSAGNRELLVSKRKAGNVTVAVAVVD